MRKVNDYYIDTLLMHFFRMHTINDLRDVNVIRWQLLKIIYNKYAYVFFEKAIHVYDCCVVNDILYTSYLCKILMLFLLIVCLLTNITTLIIVI